MCWLFCIQLSHGIIKTAHDLTIIAPILHIRKLNSTEFEKLAQIIVINGRGTESQFV